MRHQSRIDVSFRSYQEPSISLYLNGLQFPSIACFENERS